MNTLELSVVIACQAAFILLLAKKVGVIERIQIYGNDLFAELASCNFCLSWWTCLIISVMAAIGAQDLSVIVCAFIATPITRILL